MIDEYPIPLPFAGVNTRDDQYILGKVAPNMLVDILNMDFYQGGLKTRTGYITYSGVITAGPVMNLYAYNKKNGTKILLSTCGTNIYKETSQGVFSSIKSGIRDGNLWEFTTLSDLAIGVNGINDDAFKYDGTTVYPLRITPPATTPTAVIAGAGSITGTYKYKVTYVSKWGAETNPCTNTTEITATSNSITITPPVGGSDIAERRIYRTTNGGSVFYLLGAVLNNTVGKTYNDNATDTQLSTTLIPYDHDQPPTDLDMIAEWKQFLWGVRTSEPMRIYFSHQGYPEIFNTDEVLGYYVEVGRDNGENIIGIHKLQSNFYAFKENSTWPIAGDTPDDFKVAPEPINGAIGLYQHSIEKMPTGELIGLHRSGVYLFDGYRYVSLTDRDNDSIQSVIDNLNPNRLKYARGFLDKLQKRYMLTVSESGYSYNNKTLVFDYLRNKWTIYDIKANDIILWNDAIIFGSSQSDGYIYKSSGTSDNGTAISVRVEWPWWGLWDADTLKTVRYIMIDTTQDGDYEPTVTAYTDGSSIAIPVKIEDRSLWGSGRWVLDGGKYRIKKLLRVDKKGLNSLKIKFTHAGLNQPVTIAGLNIFGYASDMVAVK